MNRHVMAKVFCDCNNNGAVKKALLESCQEAGFNVVDKGCHDFTPQGTTAFVVLSESHASIHTYPEHGYLFIDIFTCGDMQPEAALEYFLEYVKGKATNVMVVDRD